jgi:HTH-type transcriptional regulator, sugar sensing transcriptional regulator
MANDLNSLFRRLGFSEQEAHLLITLYKHPSTPAGRIAEYAGLKRGHTYNLLSTLLARGVVQEFVERGVKRFNAITPTQLMERVEQQRIELLKLARDLGNSVNDIEALCPGLQSVPQVRVFRGSSGVKELYQLTLKSKEKVTRSYADFSSLFPRKRDAKLNQWLWDYAKRRAKKGIIYRGILTRSLDSDTAFRTRKVHKRELRLLEGKSLSVEINIFDTSIAIASTSTEMMGVLIESETIAETMKQLFDALWVNLPVYSPSTAQKRK